MLGAEHLARITEPALVIQSDADTGVFPSDAKAIFQQLSSTDKALHMITGDHYLRTPQDAKTVVADLIDDWLKSRL